MKNRYQGYDEDRYDLDHTEKKIARRKLVFKMLFWIISIPLAVAAGIFLCKILIAKTTVPNNSMNPTLQKGDKIVIDMLSYRISDPKRFDVIVFRHGDEEHDIYDIKRVYALPGETIQISAGKIMINGKEIKDKISADKMDLAGVADMPYKLADDEYFVLAEDRNKAEDSRYMSFGMVKKDDIIGRAWIRTNKLGFVNMMNKAEEKENKKER